MTELNVTVNGISINLIASNDSSIAYDDTWQLIPRSGLNSNTTSDAAYAGQPGSTLSFDFTGIALLAASTLPATLPANANQTLPNVTITLDDQPPTRASAARTAGDAFFSAGPISAGAHKLSITVDDASPEFPFILDVLAYFPVQDVAQAYNASSSASIDAASGADAAKQQQIQNLINQLKVAQQKERGPPVAAIVGGTIGGVVLLSLISYAVWYLYVRPRRNGGRAFFYAPAKASDMLEGEFDLDSDPYPLLSSKTGQPRSPSLDSFPTGRSSAHAPSLS
ncbi:uncharacterized protein TRAVEDRAFT_41140 [Trametes versicolor FP-101664 SS1]|uniref:uncharacterized protein n=1 Tax=Trametes versicolor (strain FP-101664) TaxID=717944 RepID=UPI0004623586|nr:uncharacterized protein TRAVEDRAFT_41140 [Trametes versicolor FP-101664 SS1]EIW63710.1 hypothetical protein TRAVEDRAFT_41140 [Trametes versicolor FP-101664 SS1]